MQIAKLFAGLGFQVDTSGLVKFKRAIADARSEMTNISRGAKTATNQFRNLRRETDKLSSSMNKIKNAGGSRNVGGSYRNLAGDIHRVRNALDSIATNQPRTTKALGKINAAIIAGTPHWNAYRRSIVQTRQTLQNLNGDLARLRANSRIDVRIRNTGGNGGGGSGGGSGGLGGAGALGGAFGLRAMMGSFLPALAVSSAGGALGFGAARGVEAAREQTRMESMILMTSKSGEEFARTIDYVKGEAARLGLSSTELGKSFAQINMAARGLDQGTKEKMFTGFSEFMMSMGTSADDQKGIFRAFNQMFSNNRILQEEINQLSERGIPATLVYDAAMKAYDTTNIQKIKKLQEDGKLDPKKVLPIMAQMVQDLAHDSGSYAKMMESSIVKQGKMYEQLRQTSKQIMDSGLDVWLGKIFGQLTEIVSQLGDVAKALEYIVKQVNTFKKTLDDVSGGNGGGILLFLSLLIFRFKALRLGAHRAFIVLQSGGKITRALGELFTGVLGRSLKMLILRFGGWIAVIYGAYKALGYLGRELKQMELGNWTIFDTIAITAESAWWKVKVLIAELKWLKTFMTSGAMTNSTIDEMMGGLKKRAKGEFEESTTPYLAKGVTWALSGAAKSKFVIDKILGNEKEIRSSGTPSTGGNSYNQANSKDVVVNFFDKDGNLNKTVRTPVTMNP
ncbi:Tail tape measure protein [Psychrobacter phage D'Alembert]|nr:Tail tape measure protein [Psychrobacter phage D'Alembert]